MFNNVSMGGIGMVGVIVYLIISAGQFFGIDVAEASATEFVHNVIGAAGFLLWAYGQWRRNDLKYGLIRK